MKQEKLKQMMDDIDANEITKVKEVVASEMLSQFLVAVDQRRNTKVEEETEEV